MKTVGWLLILFGAVLIRASLKGQVLDAGGKFVLLDNLNAEATALITGNTAKLKELDSAAPGAGVALTADIQVPVGSAAGAVASTPSTPGVLVTLNPPGSGNWQGAVRDVADTTWYVALAGTALAKFFHMLPSGKWETMTVPGGDHPTSFGVHNGTVYFTHGGRVKCAPYRDGVVAAMVDTPWRGEFAFDASRSFIVIRNGTHYQRYSLTATSQPIGSPIVTPRGARQGFGSNGDRLNILTGVANGVSTIMTYSWSTGELVGTRTLDLSAYASAHTEVEGMDGDSFGVKKGNGAARRLYVVIM